MREFALDAEVEELEAVAERLARSRLAPHVREHEEAGRWPAEVMSVLDGMPLGGLDLPEWAGGVDAGCLAKAVILEALARADAGGLAAADRPGPAAGAVLACPDAAVQAEVLAGCRDGTAHCAFTVVDAGLRAPELFWAPGWPALRWIFATEGDTLRQYEVTGTPDPVSVLAFQASGGVSVPLADAAARGSWALSPQQGLAVRGRARLWGASVAVGIGAAALEETIAYTTERMVFGKPVAHHQGNAFDLAAAAAGMHAARLVVRDAAASFDDADPDAGFWATQAWLETMDAAFVATNLGIQLLGGHGFIVDHLAEKRFREARHLAMLCGGRDGAELDVAAQVLDVPDPLLAAWEGTR
jgi:alkylation response protein AidB-like acyl-CoA dehydrogenase